MKYIKKGLHKEVIKVIWLYIIFLITCCQKQPDLVKHNTLEIISNHDTIPVVYFDSLVQLYPNKKYIHALKLIYFYDQYDSLNSFKEIKFINEKTDDTYKLLALGSYYLSSQKYDSAYHFINQAYHNSP